MMTKSHAVSFFIAACAFALVACPSPKDASSPSAGNKGPSCARTDDCVLVRADPCNRCGGCPSNAPMVMTAADLKQMTDDPACRERLGLNEPRDDSGVPPPAPNCGPCAGDTAYPTAHVACIANHCAMRCTDEKIVGDRRQETEVECH